MEGVLQRSGCSATAAAAHAGGSCCSSSSRSPQIASRSSSSRVAAAASSSYSASSSYANGSHSARKVLGVQLPSKVARGKFWRWRAVSEVVGESNIPPGVRRVKETKVVKMVDPVEAKRLAALEMEALQRRNERQRQREIEAINGGWALLGLTAGIVIEGYTGKSILLQIAGYLDSLADILTGITPS